MHAQSRHTTTSPHQAKASTSSRLGLILMGLLAAFGASDVLAGPSKSVPQRLACGPGTPQFYALSLNEDATPTAFSGSLASGTRECELQSQGEVRLTDADQWVLEWHDEELSTHYRVNIRRLSQGAFQVQIDPAQCNVLALPKTLTLARTRPGCQLEDDREAALRQFWNELRDSIARRDALALQALAMPRPLFAEGPVNQTGSPGLLAQGVQCMSELPLPRKPQQTLGQLLLQPAQSIGSAPWLLRDGRDRISLAGVLELRWLAQQGWRIDWINASRRVLSDCRKER